MAARRPGWWEGRGAGRVSRRSPGLPASLPSAWNPLPARTPQSEGALVPPPPDRVRRDPSARGVLAGAGGVREGLGGAESRRDPSPPSRVSRGVTLTHNGVWMGVSL